MNTAIQAPPFTIEVAASLTAIIRPEPETGGFSADTGHFTQVVWRGTREVGCGHAQCNGNDIWVCQYDPPGNFEGQYQQQVLPSSCKR